MIQGFEEQTQPLTDAELELLPLFVRSFNHRKGKINAITNKDIIAKLKDRGISISEPRVRKIINHIRNEALVPGLVASSEGYYVSDNPSEIEGYIKSLAGRISAISKVKDSMVNYLKSLL